MATTPPGAAQPQQPVGWAVPTKKRKKWPIVLAVIAGLFLVTIGGCVALLGAVADETTIDDDDKPVATGSIGDTVEVEGTEYKVTSVRRSATFGGEFTKEKADGIFIVVRLRLINRKDDTRTISSSALKLRSRDGKMYEPDTDAQIAGDGSLILEEIQPDLPKRGTLVYDVPKSRVKGIQLRAEDLFSDSFAYVRLGL